MLLNAPSASAVSWTDWNTTFTAGAAGTGSGAITAGSDTVNVTLNGLLLNVIQGNQYYVNYPATYGGLTPSDLIQESGSGNVLITFDKAVVNPYIALVSVGQSGLPVDYTFSNLLNPIEVVSFGQNQWVIQGTVLTGINLKDVSSMVS